MTIRNRKPLIALIVAAGSVLAIPAMAQSADAAQPVSQEVATDVGEIVVTGSRIRRDPTNAPTPLIQITREEMDQSGEANVVDYLADIPALTVSTVPDDTPGSNLNDCGLSLLNLRALGSNRNLVLLDGRRLPMAPSAKARTLSRAFAWEG